MEVVLVRVDIKENHKNAFWTAVLSQPGAVSYDS